MNIESQQLQHIELNSFSTTLNKHVENVVEHLQYWSTKYNNYLNECCGLIKASREAKKEVLVLGSGYNSELAGHTNVDWLKFARLKTIDIGIPILTAYGNDYAENHILREYLHHRGFGKNNVIIGINVESFTDDLMEEAFAYNAANGGCNILITTSANKTHVNEHLRVTIETDDNWLAGDVAQTFMHFIGSMFFNMDNPHIQNKWSESYIKYVYFLCDSLSHETFSHSNIKPITSLIHNTIKSGKSIYTFGNGGSAAMSSYFTSGLHLIYANLRNIIDLSSYYQIINNSIKEKSYKTDVFSKILEGLNPTYGDVLLGISTSGNSGNIFNTIDRYSQLQTISILGFGDGGKIGKSGITDYSVIVPDRFKHKSYAIAEDGQRISLTAILKELQKRELNGL